MNPQTLAGVFIGAMMVFMFSGLTMNAVGRAAGRMVEEVRRQFREIKGIMEGKAEPDYARCVAISTRGAQIEMIAPEMCRACNWEPVKPNNDGQRIKEENLWLIVPIPSSVVWFYICPSCGFIMPNDNAIDNVKKLNETKSRKIVTAKPEIKLPGNVIKSIMEKKH